jgi:hypothetical protein
MTTRGFDELLDEALAVCGGLAEILRRIAAGWNEPWEARNDCAELADFYPNLDWLFPRGIVPKPWSDELARLRALCESASEGRWDDDCAQTIAARAERALPRTEALLAFWRQAKATNEIIGELRRAA